MKKISLFLLPVFTALLSPGPVWAAPKKIKIVTTTTTFASIAKEIAGEDAEIYSIASPHRDIHFISPTPKDVMKLKKADFFIHGGLDLEAWRGPLLDAVGRTELMVPSGERQIDVSKGIPLLEIPTSLSRAEGDIHAFGNPHYWTDPENAKIIADNIAEGFARAYPDDAEFFRKNSGAFKQKIDEKMKDWANRMGPYQGTPVITYHKNWSYFAQRFGLVVLEQLEPKPGIPPTAKHVAELIKLMKEKKVKVIIKETYQESRTPNRIAETTGAAVLTLAQTVGELKEATDYASMIDYNISLLEKALSKKVGAL